MYCGKCGKPVVVGVLYCGNCGAPTKTECAVQKEDGTYDVVQVFNLFIQREHQYYRPNPPMKVSINGNAPFNVEDGQLTSVHLCSGRHTMQVRSTLRMKKEITFDIKCNSLILLRWSPLTGQIKIEKR